MSNCNPNEHALGDSTVYQQGYPYRRILLIFIVALAVRLAAWNLIDSLYRDSVNFIVHAAQFSTESLRDKIQEPMHPLILKGIHRVLFPREADSKALNQSSWEFSVFVDGLLFTLICLWLLFAIGRHLHSPEAGLWAAFFLAIMPYGVEYSINGLSEFPFLALLLLSMYLVLKSQVQYGGWMFLAGLCSGLIVLTRKEGIVLIPVILLYLFFRRKTQEARPLRSAVFFAVAIVGVVVTYYLIGGRLYWIDRYLEVLWKITNRRFGLQAMGDEHYVLGLHWIENYHDYLTRPLGGWFKLSGFFPAILFVIYLVKRRSLKINPGAGLLVGYAGAHVLMTLSHNLITKCFVTRYLFPVCIVLLPLAGIMLTEILIHINLKYGKPATHRKAGLITGFIFLAVLTGETIQNGYSSRHPEILAAARWLGQNVEENTLVFTSDDRVGFYSGRPWQNVILYKLSSEIQALPSTNHVTYLAISHKSDKKAYAQARLNELKKHRNIRADLVEVFADRKNDVAIYRLWQTSTEAVSS